MNELDPVVAEDLPHRCFQPVAGSDQAIELVHLSAVATRVIAEGTNDLVALIELRRVSGRRFGAAVAVDDDGSGLAIRAGPGKRREGNDRQPVTRARITQAAPQGPST